MIERTKNENANNERGQEMKKITKASQAIMDKMTAKINKVGDHVKIDTSSAFMPVSVEAIGEVNGGDLLIAVAHWGEQNGDLMRDPEVVMIKSSMGYFPISFRNDYVAVNNEAVIFTDKGGIKGYYKRMQADIASFTNTWMKNIKNQQNLKAVK